MLNKSIRFANNTVIVASTGFALSAAFGGAWHTVLLMGCVGVVQIVVSIAWENNLRER